MDLLQAASENYPPAKIEYALSLATVNDAASKNVKRAEELITQIKAKEIADLVSLYEAQAVIYYLTGNQHGYKKALKKLVKQAEKNDLPVDIIKANVLNIVLAKPIQPLLPKRAKLSAVG